MNKVITPFTSMPKNIAELLTKEDYMRALLHPAGMQRGIFEEIHFNKKYPQWHNVIVPQDAVDQILIYSENNRWEKVPFEGKIWKQFHNEYVNCFIYVSKHKDEMYSQNSNKEESRIIPPLNKKNKI